YDHTGGALEPFLSNGTHNEAITVRVLTPAVHPGIRLFGEFPGKLAGSYHHLLIPFISSVAVNIYIIKLIIEANLLKLPVGFEERSRVPETNILNYLFVLFNRRSGEVLGRTGAVGLALHLIQHIGLPGLSNAVFNVGHF